MSDEQSGWDLEADVVVLGSGAAGLVAALAAHHHGAGDVLIIERIRPKTANYGIERRFAKQADGEWALIYYSDLQELR